MVRNCPEALHCSRFWGVFLRLQPPLNAGPISKIVVPISHCTDTTQHKGGRKGPGCKTKYLGSSDSRSKWIPMKYKQNMPLKAVLCFQLAYVVKLKSPPCTTATAQFVVTRKWLWNNRRDCRTVKAWLKEEVLDKKVASYQLKSRTWPWPGFYALFPPKYAYEN